MKSLKLKSGNFPTTIQLPGSKSYANRVLILAALRPGPFLVRDLPESTDVTILADCLRQIGLKIDFEGRDCTIDGSFPECELEGQEIAVGEGGTTARFLASLLVRGKKPYTLILGERLKERPWTEFIDLVIRFGGKASLVGNKLFLQGPLILPSQVDIDCSRTTQYASGLQLVFSDTTEVIPTQLTTSQSYWKMTEELIEKVSTASEFSVPLDWSSASYPLAYAALNQEIFFPGLTFDDFQSDAKFFNLLKSFGAVQVLSDGMKITPVSVKRNVVMDVSDALDLVPALGYFLGHVEGFHELKGISNLAHKESDRLSEVMKLLKIFNRSSETRGDSLIIHGHCEKVEDKKDLIFPDDHRMVMTGALFLMHHAGGSLGPVHAVDKSYPRFFDLLDSLKAL